MANNVSIRITNLPEIKAAFARSPLLMTKELNLAIQKTLYTIQGRSVLNTPVDTGRLRASHRTILGNLRGEVGTHTKYDIYVHYGTRYMKARPYLQRAVDSSTIQVTEFFKKAVDNVLSEIGRSV